MLLFVNSCDVVVVCGGFVVAFCFVLLDGVSVCGLVDQTVVTGPWASRALVP